MTKYWIGVVSRQHVLKGKKGASPKFVMGKGGD